MDVKEPSGAPCDVDVETVGVDEGEGEGDGEDQGVDEGEVEDVTKKKDGKEG